MPPDRPVSSTWSFAQRALACSKPRCRTVEQINVIADMLTHLAIFEGVQRDDLLAVAYFIEAKHSEAGECVLSKGQPLEQWCLLLHGSALLTRYSTQRGSEQTTTSLGPNDSWSEAALLHSTHLRRSSVTVVAGPQGCFTLRLRYNDYDTMNDFRNPLQLLPPEGTQGPLAEITVAQRRGAAIALLCCFLRRLASARSPDERTPEETSELEPFLSSLPAYRAYPPELVACLAAACRSQSLPAGSLVYEHSTLADAHVTVLSGEVQLRKLGGQPGGEETEADGGGSAAGAPPAAAGTAGAASGSAVGGAASGASAAVRPAPPPGQPQDSPTEGSSGRLNIRARLRREREARKLMQKQLDEYVSRLDSDAANADGKGGSGSQAPIKDPVSASPIDWTRVFMQKAMRTVEPMWKALHPADKAPRRRPGIADGAFDIPLDGSEGPITEVAQLLGPAAAKAYYRGLQSQGYSDTESPSPSGSSGSGGVWPSDAGGGGAANSNPVREKWRRRMFMVDGPETDHERTLRSMAMRASRIIRERHARSRGRGGFDAEEMEELYGQQFASLTRGSPVGELSTVVLHSAMRKESAVAGPGGCELLLVDWEAYQQGVLAARAAVLARAATFLSSLSKERLNRLAELCLCLSVETATLLARQGNLLEYMVVVQEGEVTLLHEPSAALHTRIASVRGLAVSGSRNGRTQLLPLLATLNTSALPMQSSASGGAGAGGTGGAAAASVGPTPSGGSFTSIQNPVEITLQGLLLGEIGAGGILGEALLGSRGGGGGGGSTSSISATAAAAAAVANGHSDPSQHGHGHGQGHGQGNGHGTATGPDPHPPLSSVSPVMPLEGPKWPATVLATRASVLLVIPRSVLYMSDFDSIRSDLMRFAVERKAWLGRRVEAAYRAAAAPATTPAVFATAAGTSQSSPSVAPAPQSHPLLRRPAPQSSTVDGGGDSGSGDTTPRPSAPTTPHVGSFPRRAASSDVSGGSLHAAANGNAANGPVGSETVSPNLHHPICRRRSVESLQRSTSPGHSVVPAVAATATSATVTTVTALASPGSSAATAATTGNGHILTRPNSKWDFLDGPTSATGAVNAGGPSTSAGTEISSPMLGPLSIATGSLTRSGGMGLSIMDTAGSMTLATGMTLTGSFTSGSALVGLSGGALPLRRPSSGNLRTLKDSAASVNTVSASPLTAANGSVSGGAVSDLPSLTLAQQALLEAGLDPHLAGSDMSYGGGSGGGGTTIERHGSASLGTALLAPATGSIGNGSSVAPLPALNQPSSASIVTSSRSLTPLIVGGCGGSNSGSPAASADFDAMRTAGVATPFRSPNALTPTSHRANSGAGATGLPAASTMSSSVSLLDPGYGNTSGIALSPSAGLAGPPGYPSATGTAAAATTGVRLARASHCGGITGVRRRTDMDGSASGVALTPTVGILTAPPPALTPRIPALQALDALETAVAATASTPPSPGLYSRSARASYTGGLTPRIATVDSSWLQMGGRGAFPGGLRGRNVARDNNSTDAGGGGGGVAPIETEVEEEAALARSLVPKNQAGLFMVRGGAASTPAKLPAARRIAGCF